VIAVTEAPPMTEPDRVPFDDRRVCRSSVLRTVARRSFPRIIEATIAPAIIFYICLLTFGAMTAIVTTLLWSYCAIARRIVTRRPVPAILVLATVAFTVRTGIALATGSAFIYFIQPVLGTVFMAALFLGSLVVGRPLIARLADDFWPLEPEVAAHPAVRQLFRSLTVLWAGVNLAIAAVTFVLLVTLPVEGFVPAKTIGSYAITITGVMVTISWSIATARREGLLRAAAGELLPEVAE
jgi:intracellular septation protein A